MSSETMGVAAKTMKQAQQEMVQWENTLEGLQNKVKSLMVQRDQLQQTIDKKTADFEQSISFRRIELAKQAEKNELEIKKVSEAKEEVNKLVKELQIERTALNQEKDAVVIGKKVNEERKGKMDQFVIALQRAYTLVC